jgi:hypothetical protein
MSDTTLTGRLREFIDTYRGVDNLGYTGLMLQAADELDRLRAENARLIEDRARFPDRPDDIGRMVGSYINNLKAAAKTHEEAWHRAQTLADARAKDVEHLTLAGDAPPFTAANLLRRFVNVLASEYRRKRRPAVPFWSCISDATALGSNCSAGLATWAGLDADTATEL